MNQVQILYDKTCDIHERRQWLYIDNRPLLQKVSWKHDNILVIEINAEESLLGGKREKSHLQRNL